MTSTTSEMTRRKLLLTGAAVAAQAQMRAQTGKTVNVALIGGGHRAWAHIAVLKAIPGFRIAGIADPTPEFQQQAVALAGPDVPAYADYRRMLAERKDLQAVFVATPSGLHAEPAVACLQRGLSV